MKRKPEISVIVLTYNQSQTVGRALDSILAQQCNFPYEIVISDDSTDDATRQAIEPYVKAFPSVVRLLPKHERLGVVRNYFYALSQCRGEYIADCAGDDYWYGFGGFQRKRDILVENSEVGFVHSDWMLRDVTDYDSNLIPTDSTGSRAKYRRDYVDGREILPIALSADGEPLIHLSTVIYRKQIIADAIATNRSMVEREEWGSEDLPVIAALLASGKAVRWLAESTLVYSVGGNTITSPDKYSATCRYYTASAVMVLNLADYYGVSRKVVSKSVNAKVHYAMSQALLSGDKFLVEEVAKIIAENKIRRPIKDRLKEFIKSLVVRHSR